MILFKNIFMQIFCIFLLLILLLLFQVGEVECKSFVKRSIMDDFNKGIKYAGQMMGINTAADVANLVAKAFSTQNIVKKKDTEFQNSFFDSTPQPNNAKDDHNNNNFSAAQLISGMLKMMGFDSGKLGALALNGLILIAQMIGTAFTPARINSVPQPQILSQEQFNEGEQQIHSNLNSKETFDNLHNHDENNHQPRMERKVREGSPLDWILDNPSDEFTKLLNHVRDKNLPNYLTENVDKLEREKGDGDCVKMLICKSSPFIWGMQKNVIDRIDGTSNEEIENENRLSGFFKYLPDINEYKKHSKICEEKYEKCNASARVLK